MMFRVAPLETVCVARKFSNWNVECESGKLFKLSVKFQHRSSMSIVEIPLGCEFYANQKQTKHKKLDVSLCWMLCGWKKRKQLSQQRSESGRDGSEYEQRTSVKTGGNYHCKTNVYPSTYFLSSFVRTQHNWIKFELWIITALSLTHR